MIDLAFIESLIRALDESSLDSLELERGGTRIRLAKSPHQVSPVEWGNPGGLSRGAGSGTDTPVTPPVPEAATLEPSGAEVDQPEAETDRFLEVTSPMVGTFYRAPSPDSPPYVDVGAAVGKGSVLCIIEAMKLMNELECEVEGTVARILVENAQPVEYGQVLFLIDPS
jgi:acetyl-CoA carboxylase biotin carboxyl carrier protein